jgi:hypothetical protein
MSNDYFKNSAYKQIEEALKYDLIEADINTDYEKGEIRINAKFNLIKKDKSENKIGFRRHK